MIDFTLEKYKDLCHTMQQKYAIYPVYEYLLQKPTVSCIILRHDVDRKVMNSLSMATLEHHLGIRSTYYFRYPYTFDKDVIGEIHNLGHEIGYHYEVLSKTNGDFQKAISLFEKELQEFRKICRIDTICMHGRPQSRFDNRDLWKKFRFEDFGIFGEAFLSLTGITYFTDTGRNWAGQNNMRDYLSQSDSSPNYTSTDDLIHALRTNSYSQIYLSVHPQRWGTSLTGLIQEYSTDLLLNAGKKIISVIRR
jgi:hypothetical protein